MKNVKKIKEQLNKFKIQVLDNYLFKYNKQINNSINKLLNLMIYKNSI